MSKCDGCKREQWLSAQTGTPGCCYGTETPDCRTIARLEAELAQVADLVARAREYQRAGYAVATVVPGITDLARSDQLRDRRDQCRWALDAAARALPEEVTK